MGLAMDVLYRTLVQTAYGDKAPKEESQYLLDIKRFMLIVLLRGMVKIRVGFETEYGAKYSHMCVDHYTEHTIQTHHIMGDFKAASFHKLPHISLIIANHIFKQIFGWGVVSHTPNQVKGGTGKRKFCGT